MSSSFRIAESRANGKSPRRPVTPAGETHSAADLSSPGHTAQIVCLKTENQADYIKLHEGLIGKHAPADIIEHFIVQQIATTRWRLQRACLMENSQLVRQMDGMMDDPAQTHASMDQATRAALCLRTLTQTSPSFKFLLRYKRSLSRQLKLWLSCLADSRAIGQVRNEP